MSSDQTVPTEGLIAGRYRLVRRIAEGGMGEVHLAIDERLSRRVAVKVLPATAADDPDLVSRFRREAQLAAGLSHANIVSVYDFVEDEGPLCLVMEFVAGQTLRHHLDRTGALTVRESVRILTGVLRGLAAAHREGLIHRDVKPENVLLGQDGSVKVTDFGLAREASTLSRTDFGHVLGTIHYLAPEQLHGQRADERSDVYAVGLVLVDLLTGRRAMQGETHAQVAAMHANGAVPLASERVSTVPLEMDRLIARATALDPTDRPGSAGEFLAELREATRLLSDAELDADPVYVPGMQPQQVGSTGTRTATMPEPDAGPAATAVLPSLAHTSVLPVGAPAGRSGAATTVLPVSVATDPVGAAAADVAMPATTSTASLPPASGPGSDRAEPHEGPTRRRRWPWVLLILALVAGGAGGWLWYDSTGPGAQRIVPPLVHLAAGDAEKALAAVDLRADQTLAYSETEPRGQVMDSTPPAAAQIRKHSSVTLVVSQGPERYAVPKLVERPQAEVAAALADRHLILGPVTEEFSETVAAGIVLRQDPAPDASVKRDTTVAITVSKGREPIPVAKVTGKSVEEATALLKTAGLAVTVADAVNSETVPSGAIVSQSPDSGTLFRGDTVTIVPSKGPVLIPVPDVTLRKVAEAEKTLTDAGFKVTVNKLFGGALKTVRFQDPAGGTMVRRGTTITLTVI